MKRSISIVAESLSNVNKFDCRFQRRRKNSHKKIENIAHSFEMNIYEVCIQVDVVIVVVVRMIESQ